MIQLNLPFETFDSFTINMLYHYYEQLYDNVVSYKIQYKEDPLNRYYLLEDINEDTNTMESIRGVLEYLVCIDDVNTKLQSIEQKVENEFDRKNYKRIIATMRG